jgi:hypothetical protein
MKANEFKNIKYYEQIYYFNDFPVVLEFINIKMNKYDIWLY